jgi:hypothetical protein
LDVPGAETAECGEGKSDLDEERRVEAAPGGVFDHGTRER